MAQHLMKTGPASMVPLAVSHYPLRTAFVGLLLAGLIAATVLASLACRPMAPATIAQESAVVVQPGPIAVHPPITAPARPAAVRCDPRTITGDLIYGGEGTARGNPMDVYRACAALDQPAAPAGG
jgi:hypothetical protein